jgi:hypothetical protein
LGGTLYAVGVVRKLFFLISVPVVLSEA